MVSSGEKCYDETMSSLDHILMEIRDLSQAELQELTSLLQTGLPANRTQAVGQQAPVTVETCDEFDADLDAVAFAAPPLAPTISRADIYDEHD